MIDVVPAILEVTGIDAPLTVDGIVIAPIEGTSFAYAFDTENADAPSRHRTRSFEMMGQWALYHEGRLLSKKGEPDALGNAENPEYRSAEKPGAPVFSEPRQAPVTHRAGTCRQ